MKRKNRKKTQENDDGRIAKRKEVEIAEQETSKKRGWILRVGSVNTAPGPKDKEMLRKIKRPRRVEEYP